VQDSSPAGSPCVARITTRRLVVVSAYLTQLDASALDDSGNERSAKGTGRFGNSSVFPRLISDFTDPAGFVLAAASLEASGANQPGYGAIVAALNGGPSAFTPPLTYRPGAVKNVTIITDEISNSDQAGGRYPDADALITAEGALLNGIIHQFSADFELVPGGSYRNLVERHGGTIFDLDTFNTTDPVVISAFIDDFAATKLDEILSIPEPGTALLLALRLAGMGAGRRRSGNERSDQARQLHLGTESSPDVLQDARGRHVPPSFSPRPAARPRAVSDCRTRVRRDRDQTRARFRARGPEVRPRSVRPPPRRDCPRR